MTWGGGSNDPPTPPESGGLPPPDAPPAADAFPPPDPVPPPDASSAVDLGPPDASEPPAPPTRSRRVALVGVAALVLAIGLIAFLLLRGGGGEITTPAGTLTVAEVAFSDTWPPNCGEDSFNCGQAEAGFKVLLVYLEGDGDQDALSDAVVDAGLESPKAFVKDSTGARTEAFAAGTVSGRLLIAFTPPEDATGFTLWWPGNETPIELGV